MPTTAAARGLLRAAFMLLLFAALTALWATLARQAPGSPLYLGTLSGPIEAVRNSASVIGLVFMGVAWLLPHIASARAATLLVVFACVGAALELGAGTVAALHGLHAIQVVDPRPDVAPLVALKYLGQLILTLCLLDITRRVWSHRS